MSFAHHHKQGFSGAGGKESACNAGDTGDENSTPGLGRSPEGGNDNPLQYSCLEKIPWTEEPGGLQFPGVAKSWT